MSKTIVIVGITGNQGSSVAHTFLRFPEWQVRGITRNPSSEASQALAANGVEIVKADLDDKQSLFPAFEGATAIFSNTDFFIHLRNVLTDSPPGRTPTEYAFNREVSQGINIAEAAASPAVLKTLERFVLSSLSDARKWSGGKYTTLLNPKSHLWFAHKDKGSFVKVLVDMPPGKHLHSVSQTMTFPEWMTLWGDMLGVKAGFKQVSTDDFFEKVPEPLKKELMDAWDYAEEFGYTGGDPEVVTLEQLNIKIPLTSMEEYIKSEDWSSVLNS